MQLFVDWTTHRAILQETTALPGNKRRSQNEAFTNLVRVGRHQQTRFVSIVAVMPTRLKESHVPCLVLQCSNLHPHDNFQTGWPNKNSAWR